MIETPNLIAAKQLPDGSFSLEEQQPEIARRIREGDATVGWAGDPAMSLVLNTAWQNPATDEVGPRWEVWRDPGDGGPPVCVCGRPGARVPGAELLSFLARGDTRTHDAVDDLHREQEGAARRRLTDFHDAVDDGSDRLAHALIKDLSIPAAAGKLYRLGG